MPEPKIIDGVVRVSNMGNRKVSADATMTLEQQEDAIRAGIEGQGFRVGRIFEAVDHSGFTFAGSVTMDEILSRVEGGSSHGVAFAYLDRNGRNWWAQGPFFQRLANADGEYIVRGMEGIDYRSALGRQVFGTMSVASESAYFAAKERSENIVAKTLDRKVPNRVSYGYMRNGTEVNGEVVSKVDADRDAKALVPNPATARVVRRIFEMRLDGFGVGAIANALNADGIAGPRGGTWVLSTVNSIVQNEIYKGTIVFGRIKRDRSKGSNVRRVHDPAVALVTASEWERAQSTRRVVRTGANRAGVAGSVLTCSGCGHTLSVISSGTNYDERKSYGCRRVHSATGKCPKPVYVAKPFADNYVDDMVAAALAGTEGIDVVAATRRVEDARVALENAKAERRALVQKVKPTHPEFDAYLEDADDVVAGAQATYDRASEDAGIIADLPTPEVYRDLPVEARSRIAATLLRAVPVAPPVSRSKFAPIAERFTPVWR